MLQYLIGQHHQVKALWYSLSETVPSLNAMENFTFAVALTFSMLPLSISWSFLWYTSHYKHYCCSQLFVLYKLEVRDSWMNHKIPSVPFDLWCWLICPLFKLNYDDHQLLLRSNLIHFCFGTDLVRLLSVGALNPLLHGSHHVSLTLFCWVHELILI